MPGVFWAIVRHAEIIKFFQNDFGCPLIFHTEKKTAEQPNTSFDPQFFENNIYIYIYTYVI